MLRATVGGYLKYDPKLYEAQKKEKKKGIRSKGFFFYLKSAEGCSMFVRWSGSNAQRYIQYISQKIKSIVPKKKKNLEELKHAA